MGAVKDYFDLISSKCKIRIKNHTTNNILYEGSIKYIPGGLENAVVVKYTLSQTIDNPFFECLVDICEECVTGE